MPELPEVETTVRGINRFVKGLGVKEVWTDYYSEFHEGKPNIKDRGFFNKFRRAVTGKKILGAARRGKNVLIRLSKGITILVHMKMTGHLLYGKYRKVKGQKSPARRSLGAGGKVKSIGTWAPTEDGPLKDPFNRFIRVVFTLSNGKHLALSDLRRFAKVTFAKTNDLAASADLKNLGPEPLDITFSAAAFAERLCLKPLGKIKQVLMDQNVLAGIGNIYSDEILWSAGVHPLEKVRDIPAQKFSAMFFAMKTILKRSLRIGGDSESDYRNIEGLPGGFQKVTRAYGREGELCSRPKCRGVIVRIKVGGRSAHFCPAHQVLSGRNKHSHKKLGEL